MHLLSLLHSSFSLNALNYLLLLTLRRVGHEKQTQMTVLPEGDDANKGKPKMVNVAGLGR